MKIIWSLIQKTHFETTNKARLFLLINTVCCALTGLTLWAVIHSIFMDTLSGALLFALCPAFFIGILGGMWYLYQRDI